MNDQASDHTAVDATAASTTPALESEKPGNDPRSPNKTPDKPADKASGPPQVPPELQKVREGKRKWFLLIIFSLSLYLDIAGRAGVMTFVNPISERLNIQYQQSTWILNAYNVTFASTLAIGGRLSDLYSAKLVFSGGLAGLGVISLVCSFLVEKYSFFVFRAIQGVFAAATIPSAFRLIMACFPPNQAGVAITYFSLTGALANATGLIIAGIFGVATTTDQNAGWRWFFRFFTFAALPCSFLAWRLIPKVKGARSHTASKWRQFDLPGCFILFSASLLIILGLTLGASYGWKTAKFLVPFLLSWPLWIGFFWYESILPQGMALLPPSFWKLPNMPLLMFLGLEVIALWPIVQLPVLERWQSVDGESIIHSAVRCLPVGLSAVSLAFVLPRFAPRMNIRWSMSAAFVVVAVGILLMIWNEGKIGSEYWRWIVPGFILSSGANGVVFTLTNITVMTSAPPAMAGMAGAIVQIAYQVGAVIGLSVQAGLLTVKPGSISNWGNVQVSYWFQAGWCIMNAILVLVFLHVRKPAAPAAKPEAKAEETTEKRGADAV